MMIADVAIVSKRIKCFIKYENTRNPSEWDIVSIGPLYTCIYLLHYVWGS